MSFAIRGDIMGDFETVFSLTATEVGWIAGAAFWGFGVSILFGGPLCDVLGMRTLARLAALGHIGGTLLTIAAPSFCAARTVHVTPQASTAISRHMSRRLHRGTRRW